MSLLYGFRLILDPIFELLVARICSAYLPGRKGSVVRGVVRIFGRDASKLDCTEYEELSLTTSSSV